MHFFGCPFISQLTGPPEEGDGEVKLNLGAHLKLTTLKEPYLMILLAQVNEEVKKVKEKSIARCVS